MECYHIFAMKKEALSLTGSGSQVERKRHLLDWWFSKCSSEVAASTNRESSQLLEIEMSGPSPRFTEENPGVWPSTLFLQALQVILTPSTV